MMQSEVAISPEMSRAISQESTRQSKASETRKASLLGPALVILGVVFAPAAAAMVLSLLAR